MNGTPETLPPELVGGVSSFQTTGFDMLPLMGAYGD